MRVIWLRAGALVVIGLVVWLGLELHSKYWRRQASAETSMNLRKIFDAAITYYQSDHCRFDGGVIVRQFPETIDFGPQVLCAYGEPWVDAPADYWDAPTWKALDFQPDGPRRYRYRFESGGTGADAWFAIRAEGDLDCDGVTSTFERRQTVEPNDILPVRQVRPFE